MTVKSTLSLAAITSSLLLCACAMGPDYVRPTPVADANMPTAFKESWKTAQPQDREIPEKWWAIFNDDPLNALMEKVATSNLTLAQAEANYRAALALVDNATAAYYPNLLGNVGRTRSKSAINPLTGNGGKPTTTFAANLTSSWGPDIWGGLRRDVEVQQNTALSSYANAQAIRLSMQSTLAQDYFQLRVLDAQKELLDRTVEEYRLALTLTERQYQSGLVATDAVLLAQTQLESTKAQALDLGNQRAQFEHAIATLTGQPASTFAIAAIPKGDTQYLPDMPDIPVNIPSTLLERRPDVAASERAVAAANAQIGVTQAAFFPVLTLNALGGFQSGSFADWFTLPNRIWSVGPTLAATLFDGGAKRAQNAKAIAQYDASVAAYRQTVLTALQNVEDNLASLRILKEEYAAQSNAAAYAKKALNVTMSQYKAGTITYLNVVNAQTTALTNERAELAITKARLIATVQLIAALGGGWTGMDNEVSISKN